MSHGMPGKSGRTSFLDPTSGNFTSSTAFDQAPAGPSSRHNSDDENRYPPKGLGGDVGFKGPSGRPAFQPSYSGYNSSTASRSGSLPPGRNGVERSSRLNEERANTQYSHLGPSAPLHSHRQNLSTHSSYSTQTGSYGNKVGDRSSPVPLSALTRDFNKMIVGKESQNAYGVPKDINQNGFQHEYSHSFIQQDGTDPSWVPDESGYQNTPELFVLDGIPPGTALLQHAGQYRGGPSYSATYSQSSENSDPRRGQHSPFYSTSSTPSLGGQAPMQHRLPKGDNQPHMVANGQPAVLERNLRGPHQMPQDLASYPSPPNPMNFRAPFSPYDFHPHGAALRMNPLAPYYHMPPVSALLPPQTIPRGPAREHDVSQHVRSVLLEEFRNNSKTNKRYELKVRLIITCMGSAEPFRIFSTTSWNSAVISMGQGSFSRSWKPPTAMRRTRCFVKFTPMRYSS